MEWGIQTWDANGVPNNYGIKPVSVVGFIKLSQGQTTGTYSFSVPAGMKVNFVPSLDSGGVGIGRQIIASGNTITIHPASSTGVGTYPASECELVIFMENA